MAEGMSWHYWLMSRGQNLEHAKTPDGLYNRIINAIQEVDDDQVIKPYIKTPCRHREVVLARQVCMALMRFSTDMTLARIGRYFGRDHATVLHAIKAVHNRKFDPSIDRYYKIGVQVCRENGCSIREEAR